VFLEVFAQPRRAAAAYRRRWYRSTRDSGLPEMERVPATIRAHWDGVFRWFTSHISNGVLKGLNSLIQAAKAKARGYRTVENLITMALQCSPLQIARSQKQNLTDHSRKLHALEAAN
jgi:transposase